MADKFHNYRTVEPLSKKMVHQKNCLLFYMNSPYQLSGNVTMAIALKSMSWI